MRTLLGLLLVFVGWLVQDVLVGIFKRSARVVAGVIGEIPEIRVLADAWAVARGLGAELVPPGTGRSWVHRKALRIGATALGCWKVIEPDVPWVDLENHRDDWLDASVPRILWGTWAVLMSCNFPRRRIVQLYSLAAVWFFLSAPLLLPADPIGAFGAVCGAAVAGVAAGAVRSSGRSTAALFGVILWAVGSLGLAKGWETGSTAGFGVSRVGLVLLVTGMVIGISRLAVMWLAHNAGRSPMLTLMVPPATSRWLVATFAPAGFAAIGVAVLMAASVLVEISSGLGPIHLAGTIVNQIGFLFGLAAFSGELSSRAMSYSEA